MSLVLLARPPAGYAHIFESRIAWGDLWLRPCDLTWVEVGAAMVGSFGKNPSSVCARKTENKFDKLQPVSDTYTVTNLYNIGAYGIPATAETQVACAALELKWSRHALTQLVSDRYGVIKDGSFLSTFRFKTEGWTLVEAETVNTFRGEIVTKFVVRRAVDSYRSLVLVILPDGPGRGFVKTCWINLNTDNHATLDKSRYSKP